MPYVYENDTYLAPIQSIIGSFIREYDMSKANINILLYYNIITKDLYDTLYTSPKLEREKYIGLMQRKDKSISEALKHGFTEARKMLFEANDIKEYQVLAIKKDAVYTIDKVLPVTKFKNMEFKLKNTYTSFYKLDKLELYYDSSNPIVFDIKGMGDDAKELHKDYLLNILDYTIYTAEHGTMPSVVMSIECLMNEYKEKRLALGYYREFNNRSMFKTKYNVANSDIYIDSPENITKFDCISPIALENIDISFNYHFLGELLKIYKERFLYN